MLNNIRSSISVNNQQEIMNNQKPLASTGNILVVTV